MDLLQHLRSLDRPDRPEGIAEVLKRVRRGEADRPASSPVLSPLFVEGPAIEAMHVVSAFMGRYDFRSADVIPMTTDGCPLMPLLFDDIRVQHIEVICETLRQIEALGADVHDRELARAVWAFARDQQEMKDWIRWAKGLRTLFEIPWDDESELLRSRLAMDRQPAGTRLPVFVTLTDQEQAAYDRIGNRLAEIWHSDRPSWAR